VAAYLLPPPFQWLAAWKRGDLAAHHARQAAGLSSLLLATIAGIVILSLILTAALVFREKAFAALRLDLVHDWTCIVLGAIWAVLWISGICLAALGSTRPLPLAARIGRSALLRRTGAVGWTGIWILVIAVTAIAVRSTALARPLDGRPATVYILYDADTAPRWVFTLASYRIALAAGARWGEGSTVVDAISTDTIREAARHGRLVYLGTHGGDGKILFGGTPHGPPGSLSPGKDLQLVYISACHAGDDAEAWSGAFAPARVVTFPRNSVVLEHAFWLWFQAPEIVAGMR